MLRLPEPFQCSQLSVPRAFRSKPWYYCREQNSLPKRRRKVCQQRKLTEHLRCVLEASSWVLTVRGSVAHADLLAVGAPAPISLQVSLGVLQPGLKSGMLSPAQKGSRLLILMKRRRRTTEISAELFISL